MDSIDLRIALIAAPQAGAVSRRQQEEVGADRRVRARRVAAGRWLQHPGGVITIAGSPPTWEQQLWVAILGFPAGAALVARRAAAPLLAFDGFAPGRIELLVERTVSQPRPFDVHTSRAFPTTHSTVRGLPVTTPARAIFDLAALMVQTAKVERLVDAQLAAHRVRLGELVAELASLGTSGRRGIGLMRAILDERMPGYIPPASELEALFVSVTRRAGLPEATRQAPLPSLVADGLVDFTYEPERHIVEVDGRTWHDQRLVRDNDVARDNEALAMGYTTQRFGYRTLATDPAAVVDSVRRRLALGPAFGTSPGTSRTLVLP